MRILTEAIKFQHTAARRRLEWHDSNGNWASLVSTHSRPKAAGFLYIKYSLSLICFNTQPPEGGWGKNAGMLTGRTQVSTHSRPKAAGRYLVRYLVRYWVSTHSRPKAAGPQWDVFSNENKVFQHTAARRRLEPLLKALLHQVSQP